jgi:putative hydrolase of the HAD superfamily
MIDTIAFDFGNVIGFFDHYVTLRKLTPWTDMSETEMYSTIYNAELEDAFESSRIGESEFLGEFRRRCRLRCDDAFLSAAIADIFRPNDTVCALLPRLKRRYRLVLGSNTNPIHARHFLEQFAGPLKNFDALVLSYEIRTRKPGRGFYDHIIREAQCPAERCVFVDDMPANVEGARACGLKGVLYADFPRLEQDFGKLKIQID